MTTSTSYEPAGPFGDGGLVRVRLEISYDGTAFSGWARQRAQRSVQADIEDALATVLRLPAPPRLTAAGRTDSGVHAVGQVAHVDLPADVVSAALGPPEVDSVDGPPARGSALVRGANGVLANDVRLRGAAVAPAGFDARFSALARRYVYRISDGAAFDPLRRHDTLWHDRRLDVGAMRSAANGLLGLHDFAAYCKRRPDATTVRALHLLDVARNGDEILVTVEADAFCHSMVRSLVGALLAVGTGRQPASWPGELLDRRARASDVRVAPPHGLTLMAVHYPPDAELAARAAVTRTVRPAVDLR